MGRVWVPPLAMVWADSRGLAWGLMWGLVWALESEQERETALGLG